MNSDELSESLQSPEDCIVKIQCVARQKKCTQGKMQGGPKQPRLKCRYMVIFIGFWMFFLISGYRTNMSVSIVAMVNQSAVVQRAKVRSESCTNLWIDSDTENSTASEQEGDFAWTPETQGYILSSYFLGYMISQIPSGRLVERFGSKWFLFGSALFATASTFLVPLFAWISASAIIVIQLMKGLVQGISMPATAILMANWFPRAERGAFFSVLKSGFPIGSCLASFFSGFLCASSGKWPSAFYAIGAMETVSVVLVLVCLHEIPEGHPRISKAELNFILGDQEAALSKRRPKPPWRKIFTSVPVYVAAFSMFGHSWALAQFTTMHSIFLGTILHYPIEKNGFLMSMTFLIQFLAALISAWLSSLMIRKKNAGIDFVRKFWSSVACVGVSACMLGIYIAGCNRTLSVTFVLMSSIFSGLGASGSCVTAPELSPTYAGVLTGLYLTFAAPAYTILPLVVGYLTNDMQTIEQWNKVFFISIGVVMSSGIAYVIFGTAEVQPWNYSGEESDPTIEMKAKFLDDKTES